MTNKRKILIVVGAVLAVCCLGGVGGGFWLYRTYRDNAGPARAAAVAYLDDVRAGNYRSAYARVCRQTRDAHSQEEFTRVQQAKAKIARYEVTGVSVSNYNGDVSATVTVRVVLETGAESVVTIPLVKEDGEWRLCE